MRLSYFSTLSLMSLMVHAVTPVPGFYIGGIIGGTYEHNLNFTVDTGAVASHFSIPPSAIPSQLSHRTEYSTLGFDMLINGGGQIGYRFCDRYRLEFEGLYNKNPYNFLRIGDFTIYNNSSNTSGFRMNGSTSSGYAFFNAYYDFLGDETYDLVPYLGLGIGYAYLYNVAKIYYNNTLIDPNQGSIKSYTGTYAGQVIVGANYFMDNFFSVGVDARYYTTPTHTVTNNIQVTHDVQVQIYSFNFTFNGAFEGA